MAPSVSIDGIIKGLESDKVKTREQGLSDLRSFLSDRTHLRTAIEKGEEEPRFWLGIFEALFQCVREERNVVTKKGLDKVTPIYVQRVTRAGSALRWLVQLTSPHLSRKVVKPVLKHLRQSLEHRGSLFSPLSLDYVKALEAIYSHPAHLDALDPKDWEGLIRIAFAGIYDEDIEQYGANVRFKSGEADGEDWILVAGSTNGAARTPGPSTKGKGRATEDMDVDQIEEDSEDESELASTIQKKRKRDRTRGLLESQSAPSSSRPSSTRPAGIESPRPGTGAIPSKTTSLEQVALVSLIHTLLQSPHSSPLMGATLVPPYSADEDIASVPVPFPPSYAAGAILYKLLRFLATFSSETSAHLDVLRSINLVLSTIQLNQLSTMRAYTPKVVPSLLVLWSRTRSREVREQILISWKLLLPFLAEKTTGGGTRVEEERTDLLRRVLEALEGVDADSVRGGELLSMETLWLRAPRDSVGAPPGRREAFVGGSFQFGQTFSPSQATVWATLELHADLIASLSSHGDDHSYLARGQPSSPAATKRRKVEDPLSALLHSIGAGLGVSAQVSRLQVLLFLIDRHWKTVRSSARAVLEAVNAILNWEDSSIQSWALLCLAAIATEERAFAQSADDSLLESSSGAVGLAPRSPFASPSRKRFRSSDDNSLWDKAWTFAVRKAVVPAVCRAACHAAHAIVLAEKVAPLTILTDVEALVRDIEIQGPSFPYESVCGFLATAVEMASRDVRLFRMDLEAKVVNWLSSCWRVVDGTTKGFNVRTRLENHTPTDVLRLLSSLCRFPRHVTLSHTDVLPESPVVAHVVHEAQSAVVRDYVVHAHLDLPTQNRSTSKASAAAPCLPATTSPGSNDNLVQLDGCARKISTFLTNSADNLAAEWTDVDLESTVTSEKVRRSLDLVVVVLAFQAALELNGVSPERRAIKAACTLLAAVSQAFALARLSTAELAVMVQGLEPLVAGVGSDDDGVAPGSHALVAPGVMTGVRKDMLPRSDLAAVPERSQEEMLRLSLQHILWKSSDLQDAFASLAVILKDALKTAIGTNVDAPSQGRELSMDVEDEDGFRPMRVVEDEPSDPTQSRSVQSGEASKLLVSTLLICVTQVTALQTGSAGPSRHKDVFDQLLLDCDGSQFISLGTALFGAVQHGRLHLSRTTTSEIAVAFEEWFDSYRFSRDETMHLLAIAFLRASIPVWTSQSMANTEEAELVLRLYLHLTRQLETGRMRSPHVRVAFLRFVAAYLEADPSETFWRADPSPSRQDSPSLVPLIETVTRDLHVLVRFEAAVVYPDLFNFVDSMVADASKTYTRGFDEFSAYMGAEHDLTTSLLLANVLIVSSSLRKAAYYQVLERPESFPTTSLAHLESCLAAAAATLGFESLFRLWEAYCPAVAARVTTDLGRNITPVKIPACLLGYSSQKQNSEMLLNRFGYADLLLQIGDDGTERIAEIVRNTRSESQIRKECFPRTLAIFVSRIADKAEISEDTYDDVLARQMPGADEASTVADAIGSHLDEIVATLLAQLLDPSAETVGAALVRLEDGQRKADVYRYMSRPLPQIFSAGALLPPRRFAKTIVKAHEWFIRHPAAKHVPHGSIVFNALHDLASRAGKSALVIEQIRFVHSMALLVSLYYSSFTTPSLLVTLLHLSLVLMGQVDLAPVVSGILRWALEQCVSLETPPKGVSEYLVRIAHLAHSLLDPTQTRGIQALGQELLDLLEQVLEQTVSASTVWREETTITLLLWPRPLKANLAQHCQTVDTVQLSEVLSNPNLSSAKFSLVKRYRDVLPRMQPDERQAFASSSLWHLKSALPSTDHLAHRPEEMEAFMDLLYLVDGSLPAPSLQALVSLATEDRLLGPAAVRARDMSRTASIRACVAVGLADLLRESDIGVLDVAYQTLRLLRSVPNSSIHTAKSTSNRDIQDRLMLISPSVASLAKSSDRSLKEIGKAAPISGHGEWLGKVAPFLADVLAREDALFAQLGPVFAASSTFTVRLLPHLVHAVLQLPLNGTESATPKAILSSYFTGLLRSPASTVVVKRSVLDVVLHLRHFTPAGSAPSAIACEHWLELDYLLLSEAAVQCRAYTTALLFLGLRGKQGGEDDSSEDASQLLYEVYSNIEDPDGFYGVTSNDVRTSLVRRLHHEKQWDRAFTFHGAAYQTNHRGNEARSNAVGDVLESLHSFGFDKMAMAFLQGSRSTKGADEDVAPALSYDLAWRTDSWDVPSEPLLSASSAPGSALFSVLKAVHRERDPSIVARTVEGAVLSELSRMRALSTESMTELREIKSSLLCLREVKLWTLGGLREAVQSFTDIAPGHSPFPKLVDEFEFADAEKITAVRHSLLRSPDLAVGIQGQTSPAVAHLQKTCHLDLSAAARSAGQLQIAVNATTVAQQIESGLDSSSAVASEFANVLWLENEHGLAIKLLQQIESHRRPSKSTASRTVKDALHLSLLGEWTALSRTDTPERIRERYFDPATAILEAQKTSAAESALVYHRFGSFAEQQYHALDQSPDIQRLRQYKAKNDRELELAEEAGLRSSRGRSRISQGDSTASPRTTDNIHKQRNADLATLEVHELAKAYYLEKAIAMYAQTLAVSGEYDSTLVIRLSSLWLSHYEDEELNSHIGGHLAGVPSHKFVELIFQLSGRLDDARPNGRSDFQTNLQSLLYRLGKEHPYHCVYQLVTLRDAHIHPVDLARGASSSSHSRKSTSKGAPAEEQSARGRAARATLEKVSKSSAKAAERIHKLESYCSAAIAWCWWDAKKIANAQNKHRGKPPLPPPRIEPEQAIGKIKDLEIPIPTVMLAVDPSMQYKGFVSIKRVEPTFSLAGGIHLPKITTMIGSDGRSYKQLYKGDDDVRQDAIMQQLFEVVNTLLHADARTRSRALLMRTYKILPIATKTGVLEFVRNTTPIRDWLHPAHQKYGPPNHMTSNEWKDGMDTVWNAPRKDPERIKAKWVEQVKRWPPVFRHYFTEKHKDPMSWFAMRLNYARSVATTSIVGHVVGLGDRHLSNILLDQGTGELVHIDFGIAFGQGRALPIPELVPFRLTRDIIDALGISGVEGVFRRGSEETLRVLREQSKTIMTVLAVFKYDPLQTWIADANKVARMQMEAFPSSTPHPNLHAAREEATDELADRALSAVREKLDTRLSIEYTVNDLIVQATDVGNLSAIYRGWSSHF